MSPTPFPQHPAGPIPGQTILSWAALAIIVIFASQWGRSSWEVAAVRYTLILIAAYLFLTHTEALARPIAKLGAGLMGG
jgi:hypothetical protein